MFDAATLKNFSRTLEQLHRQDKLGNFRKLLKRGSIFTTIMMLLYAWMAFKKVREPSR